jgi:hypothetical protein
MVDYERMCVDPHQLRELRHLEGKIGLLTESGHSEVVAIKMWTESVQSLGTNPSPSIGARQRCG